MIMTDRMIGMLNRCFMMASSNYVFKTMAYEEGRKSDRVLKMTENVLNSRGKMEGAGDGKDFRRKV